MTTKHIAVFLASFFATWGIVIFVVTYGLLPGIVLCFSLAMSAVVAYIAVP